METLALTSSSLQHNDVDGENRTYTNNAIRSFSKSSMVSCNDSVSQNGGISMTDAGGSGMNSDNTNDNRKQQDNACKGLQKAQEETLVLKKLRMMFLCCILIIAILASVGIYYFTHFNEVKTFESSFNSYGNKILAAIQSDTVKKIEALDSLSSSFTLHATNLNLTWPFVTLPQSAKFFEAYLAMSGASWITLLPIIPPNLRTAWEKYSMTHQNWIDEAIDQREIMIDMHRNTTGRDNYYKETGDQNMEISKTLSSPYNDSIVPYIHKYGSIDTSPGPWVVSWQYAPIIKNRFLINFNHLSSKTFTKDFNTIIEPKDNGDATGRLVNNNKFTMSQAKTYESDFASIQSEVERNSLHEMFAARGKYSYQHGEPLSFIQYPVFDGRVNSSNSSLSQEETKPKVAAIISAAIYFKTYFLNHLPDGVNGIIGVVHNSENQSFTYKIDGSKATFLGSGDLHDRNYDYMGLSIDYQSFMDQERDESNDYIGVPLDEDSIKYRFTVYPSSETAESYFTNKPILFSLIVLMIFIITASMFILYNVYVERRQGRVMATAIRSNAVVSSLFPSMVRDRLFEEVASTDDEHEKRGFLQMDRFNSKKMDLFSTDNMSTVTKRSEAIADFFPEVTIMFADICGFTSWCSQREPVQVFVLLESLFGYFDSVAKRLRVFKVETVGDCYVAVCGLPQRRKQHAVIMAKFAQQCLQGLRNVLAELEIKLGPDVSTLQMRTGLHSGPVTAGVVRGDNARFQLFGDTVNTAARMESTGMSGRIQMSKDTAGLLLAAGKAMWLHQRENKVFAKGKGEMTTYWLKLNATYSDDETTSIPSQKDDVRPGQQLRPMSDINGGDSLLMTKPLQTNRLVKWAADVLARLLHEIDSSAGYDGDLDLQQFSVLEHKNPIDELKDFIVFPNFNEQSKKYGSVKKSDKNNSISSLVLEQLEHYVMAIASFYDPSNCFHSFDHAAHVTLSVTKLLSRIVTPTTSDGTTRQNHAYAIASDPLTRFACVFSALIHDCDHRGVSNWQLIQEDSPLAICYNNKSIAEQNSVDIAWNLLMGKEFKDLREAICPTESDLLRFRQIVVHAVLATDIFDRDLKEHRNARWDKAFCESNDDSDPEVINRKATIVIEHLIQASDVSHTMQHWQVYRKWNERLFFEFSTAYQNGRAPNDPSTSWYEGELNFFDSYVLPLARKLKDCGVFGVSSDEYFKYAEMNRREWQEKGKQVVADMVAERDAAESMETSNDCRLSI